MSGKNVATTRLCHPYDFGNYVATARLRVNVPASSGHAGLMGLHREGSQPLRDGRMG